MLSYSIDEADLSVLIPGDYVFVACASFEARCSRVAEVLALRRGPPLSAMLIEPFETGSQFEAECAGKQAVLLGQMLAVLGVGAVARHRVDLMAPDERVAAVYEFRKWLQAAASRELTVVMDITAMPKSILIPIAQEVLSEPAGASELLALYCEAGEYPAGELASEPAFPVYFDTHRSRSDRRVDVVAGDTIEIGWIPILGFGTFGVEYILNSLGEWCGPGADVAVFPVIGFPALNPKLFNRALGDQAARVMALLGPEIGAQRVAYASTKCPFRNMQRVLDIARSGGNYRWVGSPLGSKPATLGMVLAWTQIDIEIVIAQARSYNPMFSCGAGTIRVFPLRVGGRLTF